MADIDPSPTMSEETTNTTASKSASATSTKDHLKQKRARSQLSCTPCRQGKLKCNRQHDPACDQCIKRNRESACLYIAPPVKHKPAQNVKGRIRQLENLVVDLMNQNRTGQAQNAGETGASRDSNSTATRSRGPYSQPTPPSDNDTSPQFTETTQRRSDSPEDVDAATTPFGQMRISKDEISYVGESHWGAILNSISDLKRDLGDDEDDDSDPSNTPEQTMNSWGSVPMGGVQPHATTGLGFMLGEAHQNVTKDQLINSMPEKRVADRLLSLWFNSPDPFKPIIHAPTFQDEYRKFWRSPKDTPTMWLGLLYAIMSLASSFGLRDNDPTSPQAQAILVDVNKYHSLAASAAVMADFTKPKQHTLECLILYAAGLRSNNAFVNVWLMIGLIVRLALRMGYHRDPSHYPAITVFLGEMRRRVWSIIGMIDVLISFQLGLPSMFKTIQSDTQPPRNLLDRDFTSTTQVLPPSRGIHELTPSSYTRAKLRVVRIFADAAEYSHATVAPAYEEMMRLDRELEEAKAAIPPLLQMPDISELVTDPAEQLMCRFNLDLLYLKTKIVLHRRYMLTPLSQLTPFEQQRGIGTSRKSCVDCALRVLQHHQTIYSASQTGGQLESVKWYMGSISTHDFLLAAMVICLELSEQISDKSLTASSTGGIPCPKRGSMMEALEKSQHIWSDASARKKKNVQFVGKDQLSKGEHMFDETEKASKAMAVMLEKVKTHLANSTPQPEDDEPTPMTRFMEELGNPSEGFRDPPQGLGSPFTGVVSTYQWGNMAGVPDDLNMHNDQVFYGNNNALVTDTTGLTTGSNENSLPQSDDSSPNQGSNQLDFSMIGNMLDVPDTVDWAMWDNEIRADQQLSYADWPDQNADLSDGGGVGIANYSMRYGNAATGGTGPVIPGNATMPNGTGPTNGNISGMEFNMEMMNDVDFDISQMIDYNKNWALTPNGGGGGQMQGT